VLLWPIGLSHALSDEQVDAVVAHEIGHVERRDNLAALGLTAVQTLFWFHPIVWWIGARWRQERERACDERVLARDDNAARYADGILKVGEFCVGGMAMDHARMAGARLTERIEAIMDRHTPKTLGWTGRAGLAIALAVVVFGPVMFGATRPADLTSTDTRDAGAFDRAVTPSQDKGLSGVVTDPTGGLIPGATVSARLVGSATDAASAVSRADGRFALSELPAGSYDVRVELPAFRTFTRRVQIDRASGAFVNAELALGRLSETLHVKTPEPGAVALPAIAEGEWQAQLNKDPGNAALFFELAKQYYQRERFVESDSMAQQGIDLMNRGVPAQPPARVASGQVGGNVKEPRKIRDVKPVYPSAALSANVTGVVVLEATIGRAGTVGNVRVVRSVSGLDQTAAGAVRQWIFTPTFLNGQPVDVEMTVTITFEGV
jgi:TonB family protein